MGMGGEGEEEEEEDEGVSFRGGGVEGSEEKRLCPPCRDAKIAMKNQSSDTVRVSVMWLAWMKETSTVQ